jgi:hypothetical protein
MPARASWTSGSIFGAVRVSSGGIVEAVGRVRRRSGGGQPERRIDDQLIVASKDHQKPLQARDSGAAA